jgi:zinc/manganese transport system permease protein
MTTVSSLLSSPFIVAALLAGTVVALASGLVGTVLVLRGELFTADALSHVAFTGALAAFVAGKSTGLGLTISCVGCALGLHVLVERNAGVDSVIGTTFAWILGLGTLLLSLSTATGSGSSGATSTAVLFGSLFTLSTTAVVFTVLGGLAIIGALIVLGRPLIFSTIDRPVAVARGVRVRALGYGFAAIVGLTAAISVQSIGALLFLGLLAAPAGAALSWTRSPFTAMALSAAIAVFSVVGGIAIASVVSVVPPTAAITMLAAAAYVVASVSRSRRGRHHGHEPHHG